MPPLAGTRVVSLALNVPGPVAAARLRDLGATVTKVEPPEGDPLALAAPGWYAELTAGQDIVHLDLKDADARAELDRLFGEADLLLTAQRPAALERLGLGRAELSERFPRLCHVAIVGHPEPDQNRPGHDLTYLASRGLVSPPDLPRTLAADLGGALLAVEAALAALLERGHTGTVPWDSPCDVAGRYVEVPLAGAADLLAEPLRRGLTGPGGVLGGGLPAYNLYETSDGWVAVAALEPRFQRRLADELRLEELSHGALERAFRGRSAAEWEAWAAEHDLPIAAVKD